MYHALRHRRRGAGLNDLASVKAFADRVATVDLLVLNAGIMALNQKELTVDGFEKQIGVNHFGHAYLTRLLRPKLEARGTAAAPSRVVVVRPRPMASPPKWTAQDLDLDFKQVKYSPWGAYGNSKLANILFAKALAKRLPETVTAVSLHPGRHPHAALEETAASGGIGGFLLGRFMADKSHSPGRRDDGLGRGRARRAAAASTSTMRRRLRSARTRRKTTRARTRRDLTEARLDAAVAAGLWRRVVAATALAVVTRRVNRTYRYGQREDRAKTRTRTKTPRARAFRAGWGAPSRAL